VEDKSNEIKAIPNLLSELGTSLQGSTVSIDVIGCQKEIGEQILDVGAHYLLAVKENQADLLEEIQEAFQFAKPLGVDETWDYDHGRYEERKCDILSATDVLSPNLLSKWKGIQTIIRISSIREIKDVKSSETRFYISIDHHKTPAHYNQFVRGHWDIENRLHWHLDVTFHEDACRARTANAPQNLNILRKIALYRLTKIKDRLSLKKRRYRASLNNQYLLKILTP